MRRKRYSALVEQLFVENALGGAATEGGANISLINNIRIRAGMDTTPVSPIGFSGHEI